jgi:hypothetical protein
MECGKENTWDKSRGSAHFSGHTLPNRREVIPNGLCQFMSVGDPQAPPRSVAKSSGTILGSHGEGASGLLLHVSN